MIERLSRMVKSVTRSNNSKIKVKRAVKFKNRPLPNQLFVMYDVSSSNRKEEFS